MKSFKEYLKTVGEVGYISQVFHSIVYVSGLPAARPGEVVIMESGETGQVLSLSETYVEVLLFSAEVPPIGTKVARIGKQLSVNLSQKLLGLELSPLGLPVDPRVQLDANPEERVIDTAPRPLSERKNVSHTFMTGVSIVDLVVPIGRGQRELVLGDRKIGKTPFLMQLILSNAKQNGVTIYAGIARRFSELSALRAFLDRHKIADKVTTVVSLSTYSSGLIFLTPFTAMTIAEYFRDLGRDVLLILDDLTIHATYYREISLLAKRLPGRSSYPGDVFYLHARLIERAGNFTKGSITCFPVAETVFSDFSGYIQTNLMSMTDGHLFFDHELFNKGRRPPVNPFLSVSRVGRQTQSPFLQSMSSELNRFLVEHEKTRQLVHFGGELTESTKKTLSLGDRLISFFDQAAEVIVPLPLNVFLVGLLFAGFFLGDDPVLMRKSMESVYRFYHTQDEFRKRIDQISIQHETFEQLVSYLKENGKEVLSSVPVS